MTDRFYFEDQIARIKLDDRATEKVFERVQEGTPEEFTVVIDRLEKTYKRTSINLVEFIAVWENYVGAKRTKSCTKCAGTGFNNMWFRAANGLTYEGVRYCACHPKSYLPVRPGITQITAEEYAEDKWADLVVTSEEGGTTRKVPMKELYLESVKKLHERGME